MATLLLDLGGNENNRVTNSSAQIIQSRLVPQRAEMQESDWNRLEERKALPKIVEKHKFGTDQHKTIHSAGSSVETVRAIDDDGVRIYRMSVAKEIRRIKSQIEEMHLEKWRGEVEITGFVTKNQLITFSVAKSSGDKQIDDVAVGMLKLATNAASLPEELRGKQFSLSFEVRFAKD
jgi:hypothetical protein